MYLGLSNEILKIDPFRKKKIVPRCNSLRFGFFFSVSHYCSYGMYLVLLKLFLAYLGLHSVTLNYFIWDPTNPFLLNIPI